jgi:hypothetical protein
MTACDAITDDVANVIVYTVDSIHVIVGCLSSTIRAVAVSKFVIFFFRQLKILVDIFVLVHVIWFVLDVVPFVCLPTGSVVDM